MICALERQKVEKAEEWYCQLIVASIAFYLAEPEHGETIEQAYARGLGYETSHEADKARTEQPVEWLSKVAEARQKLLEKFGGSIEDSPKATLEAYGRMKSGLPPHYRQALRRFAREQNARRSVEGYERRPPSLLDIIEQVVGQAIQAAG